MIKPNIVRTPRTTAEINKIKTWLRQPEGQWFKEILRHRLYEAQTDVGNYGFLGTYYGDEHDTHKAKKAAEEANSFHTTLHLFSLVESGKLNCDKIHITL